MKRLIFSLSLALLFVSAYSQGEMDALKYSQTDIMGTARYMSMGGAFGALGADASSIIDNPAGLAVYRKSELSFTPNIYINNTETTSQSSSVDESRWNFNMNNFALILSYLTGKDKGLVASNFGFTYNRLKNFHSDRSLNTQIAPNSILYYAASDNSSDQLYNLMGRIGVLENGIPFNTEELPDNKMSITEKGRIDEWNFTYGANLSNLVYLGIGLGIKNIDYKMSTYYHEDYYVLINSKYENDGNLNLNNSLNTTGSGANLKLGVIVRPVDLIRLSFAFQTPTFYDLQDDYSVNANSLAYSDADSTFYTYSDNGYDFSGVAEYGLNTPFKINAGLAFVFNNKGILSAEYEMNDYSKTNFDEAVFFSDNQLIKSDFEVSNTFKFGGEYRISDMFSARAGYAFSTSPVKSSVENDPNAIIYTPGTTTNYTILKDNSYYTAGFGYKENNFFMDFAYLLNVKNENLYPYYSSGAYEVKSKTSNIVCTFGWRF